MSNPSMPLSKLNAAGQRVWYDHIHRGMITTGGIDGMIIVRSHIGYGSPNKQDAYSAHGSPLGEEEIRLTKRFCGWPEDTQFLVPHEVRDTGKTTLQ